MYVCKTNGLKDNIKTEKFTGFIHSSNEIHELPEPFSSQILAFFMWIKPTTCWQLWYVTRKITQQFTYAPTSNTASLSYLSMGLRLADPELRYNSLDKYSNTIPVKKMFRRWYFFWLPVVSWLACSSLDWAVWVRGHCGFGDIVLCSWARQLTLPVLLSTQVYKWVPTLHATKTGKSSYVMCHLVKS